MLANKVHWIGMQSLQPLRKNHNAAHTHDTSRMCCRTTATAQAALAQALAATPAPASTSADSITAESAAVGGNSRVQVLRVIQAPPGAGVPSQSLIELPGGVSHSRIIRSLRRSGKVSASCCKCVQDYQVMPNASAYEGHLCRQPKQWPCRDTLV